MPSSKLTIIHFVHTLYGGVASVAANIINYMQEKGHKCVIAYCVYDDAMNSMLLKPCIMIQVSVKGFAGEFMLFGMRIRDIYEKYVINHKDEKVICHVHNIQALGSISSWNHVPLICTLHSLNGQSNNFRAKVSDILYAQALRRLIKQKKPVTSVSRAIVERYAPADSGKYIKVIYNGTEIDLSRRIKREKSDKFVIGYVGNLSYAKGWDTLFYAYCLLPPLIKERTKIVAAGNESEEYSFEKIDGMMRDNNLVNKIECLGFVNNAKESVMSQFDLLVLASRNEGLGLVQVEAMGYGIPVLGRDSGGICEVLIDGYNGFVIQNENDLAKRIEQLVVNEQIYGELSRNARKTYEDKFTIETMVTAYEELYYGICADEEKRLNGKEI